MEKNDKISWKFYAMLGGASVVLVGGLYYLYNLFSNNIDYDISQDQKEKLEELSQIYQTINESDTTTEKKESESSFAIKVFKQINELSEEMFNKEFSDWIIKRKQLLKENKKAEYNLYCESILGEKMRIESIAADVILQKLNLTQYDLQSMMEKIPQKEFMELQQQMIQKQQNADKRNPDLYSNEVIIKAFKEFLNLKNALDNESKNIAQFMNDPSEEMKINFFVKLEINKFMIDDHLTNLFDLDFSMLLMLINSRQLYENPEIARDYSKLMQEFNQGY
jgi:hypothetical protein